MRTLYVAGAVIVALLLGSLAAEDSTAYHLRQFLRVRDNMRGWRFSVMDGLRGIGNPEEKLAFHLERLVAKGNVIHTNLLFQHCTYRTEVSKAVMEAANRVSPPALYWSSNSYPTNAPEYGLVRYQIEIWDWPSEMAKWRRFQIENDKCD